MTLAGSWSVVGGAHIQAFTFFMVLELSRSRSVVSNAHVQAFAQNFGPHCKKATVGTSTRADACAFTFDPQPRLFEFSSL